MSLSAKISDVLPKGATLGHECAYVLIDNATLTGDARGEVLAAAKDKLAQRLDSTALFVTIDNADLDRVRDVHLMKMPHIMEPVTVLYGFNVQADSKEET
jgi:hypothetical protein